jgi:excisionase family DNA binding protein
MNEKYSKLLTVQEAADRLGLKMSTIRLWLALRRLPSVRLGTRAIRIPSDAIDAIIERGYSPAKPEVVR